MNKFDIYQQGASLIIALIFLLILSLIGVSSMQGTTMQEKMSGNLKDRYSSFNAAEAALLEGEEQAATLYKNGTLDNTASAAGSYAASFGLPTAPTWTGEYVTKLSDSMETHKFGVGAVLKIKAESSGMTGQSVVELESIYVVK